MRISLTINGKEVKAKTGMTVLDAARQGGIQIPTLCDHPELTPSGSCRLCIVEIDKVRGYPTSCTTPAEDGMVIRTDSNKLRSLRKNILELILSEHPYTCLVCGKKENCDDYMGTIRKVGITTGCQYCPKSGSCELQTLVVSLGLKEMTFPIDYHNVPVEIEDPFFDRDYNLCILCGRCVRVCNDIRGNGTLNFGFRGGKTIISTAFGKSHLETGCEFCGACVDTCPTGALYDKRSKWEGCPDKTVPSLCPHCSVGCSLDFNLKTGELISTTPHLNGTLNHGQVCVRGRFGVVDTVTHRERLLKPLVKQDGRWLQTTWDEALDLVAGKFSQFNGDQCGMILSPQMTNEDGYVLKKFSDKVMKSRNLILGSGFTGTEINALFKVKKQVPWLFGEMKDIDTAGVLVVWNTDLSKTHPIVSLRLKQAQMKGAKLIVIDSKKSRLAERADIHIQPAPGTDLLLLSGLMRIIMNFGMDADLPSANWRELDTVLKDLDLKTVVEQTGVSIKQLEAFASHYLKAFTVFLFGIELLAHETGQDNLFALLNLVQLRLGSRIIPVLGESNWMGLTEVMGQKNNGQNSIQNREMENIPCIYCADDLPEDISFKKSKFLVAQGVFKSSWMEQADVILPAAHFNETDGTVINFEGRMQRLRRAMRPAGKSKPDWWITSQIAARMKSTKFSYKKSSDIFQEMAPIIPGWKDLTPGNLGKKGRHVENPSIGDKGSGHQFFPFSMNEFQPIPKKGYPYTLLAQWNLFDYRNGPLANLISGMNRYNCENQIEIHPGNAEKMGIQTGDSLQIKTSEGQILEGSVKISDRIPMKIVSMRVSGQTLASKLNNKTIHSVKIQKGVYDKNS